MKAAVARCVPGLALAMVVLACPFAEAKLVLPPRGASPTENPQTTPAQKPADPAQPVQPARPADPAQPVQPAPKENPARPRIGIPEFEQMFPPGTLDPAQEQRIRRQVDLLRTQVERAMQKAPAAGQNPARPVVQPVRPIQPVLPVRGQINRLGASFSQPPDVLIDQLGLARGQGLVLTDVKPDSAAAKAGLKKNDILLELAGRKVSSQPAEFNKTLDELKTGEKIAATILRGSKQEVVNDIVLPDATRPAFGRPIVRPPVVPIVPKKPNNN